MADKGLNQDDVQILIHLGLTLRQAKVYLALFQSGISSVKTISKISKVPRPDIYRIMLQLQELALAEKIINIPVKFKATPIQDGITILLNRKIDETHKIWQEARDLFNKVSKETRTAIQEEGKEFVLVPEREALVRRIMRASEDAQSSVDVICPQTAFPKGLFIMSEVYEKAMKRDVKIRWIIEKSENMNSFPEFVQALMKNPSFKLRTVPESLEARLGIFDKKEVFIATHPITAAVESSALWTSNPSLVKIIDFFFEKLWLTATEN